MYLWLLFYISLAQKSMEFPRSNARRKKNTGYQTPPFMHLSTFTIGIYNMGFNIQRVNSGASALLGQIRNL